MTRARQSRAVIHSTGCTLKGVLGDADLRMELMDPEGRMRDVTVLRQLAAHLEGWGRLHAEVVTDGDWPSVRVAGDGPGGGALVWRCVDQWWVGRLIEDGGAGEPVATIQTGIGGEASASEVADALKRIYRLLGSVAGAEDGPSA